jgi:hypothetical protein
MGKDVSTEGDSQSARCISFELRQGLQTDSEASAHAIRPFGSLDAIEHALGRRNSFPAPSSFCVAEWAEVERVEYPPFNSS